MTEQDFALVILLGMGAATLFIVVTILVAVSGVQRSNTYRSRPPTIGQSAVRRELYRRGHR